MITRYSPGDRRSIALVRSRFRNTQTTPSRRPRNSFPRVFARMGAFRIPHSLDGPAQPLQRLLRRPMQLGPKWGRGNQCLRGLSLATLRSLYILS
jgi:hypothetical protein